MNNKSKHFMGVDVGGTHLKIGLVSRAGEILSFDKEDTKGYKENPKGFNQCFVEVMGKYLAKYPEVNRVGIGLPGLISKDRTTTLEIPAIPDLNGFNLKKSLSEKYPNISFYLEHDASAASWGQLTSGTSGAS